MEPEDAARLEKIEMEIFGNVVSEVEEETKHGWSGSMKENKLADEKVAKSIRNSFQIYEKNRKATATSFFRFK